MSEVMIFSLEEMPGGIARAAEKHVAAQQSQVRQTAAGRQRAEHAQTLTARTT
jgi:hypothetical protein